MMDSVRFDRVTRLLASGLTRRSGLAAALAVLGGAAVGSADETSAAPTRCRSGRQTCQRDSQCCSGTCNRGRHVPLKDRNRCTCEDGFEQCGNACIDTCFDTRHCGVCGQSCQAGEACCTGLCIDVRDDVDNCGACGNACENGPCWGGACLDACPEARTYWHPVQRECVTAEAFCGTHDWFVGGERVECWVSAEGDLVWACNAETSDWYWGPNCRESADCQLWCEVEHAGHVGCWCGEIEYYGSSGAYEREIYENPWCIVKTGASFEIDDVWSGICGDY